MRAWVVLVGVVAFVSCGRAPAAPSKPATLALSPLVSPAFIGASQSGHAIFANGAGSRLLTAEATWTSDNDAIARVDRLGRVTGVQSGQTTIRVVYAGLTSASPVRVVPDYRVGFSVVTTIESCAVTRGNIACADRPAPATLDFDFGQEGATVSGAVAVDGAVPVPFTAALADDGSFTVDVTLDQREWAEAVHYVINSPDGHVLVGTCAFTWTSDDGAASLVETGALSGQAR